MTVLPVATSRPPFSQYVAHVAIVAAWMFFGMTGILLLLGMIATVTQGGALVTMMSVGSAQSLRVAWGLTYQGPFGLVLLVAQLGSLVGALIASTRASLLIRRAGHVWLVLWTALWVVNAYALASYEADMMLDMAISMTFLLGAVGYRAWHGWPEHPQPMRWLRRRVDYDKWIADQLEEARAAARAVQSTLPGEHVCEPGHCHHGVEKVPPRDEMH